MKPAHDAPAYIARRAGQFFDPGILLANAIRTAEGLARDFPERAALYNGCAERARARLNELRRQYGMPELQRPAHVEPVPDVAP